MLSMENTWMGLITPYQFERREDQHNCETRFPEDCQWLKKGRIIVVTNYRYESDLRYEFRFAFLLFSPSFLRTFFL